MEEATSNLKKLDNNYIASLVTGVVDYLNLSAIYTGYFVPYFLPTLTSVFRETASVAFFPLILLTSTLYTIFAWRTVHLDRDKETHKTKKENKIRAIINTTSMLILWTAIIIGIAVPAGPTIGFVMVALLGLNLVITGAYNCISAGLHWHNARKKEREIKILANAQPTVDPAKLDLLKLERQAHLTSAKGHLFVGVTLGLIALAGGLVVLGGVAPFAIVGIATGILGAAFFGYVLFTVVRKKINEKNTTSPVETSAYGNGSTHQIFQVIPKNPNEIRKEFMNPFHSEGDPLVQKNAPQELVKQDEQQDTSLLFEVDPTPLLSPAKSPS
jgi:uncharacterized membrane protein